MSKFHVILGFSILLPSTAIAQVTAAESEQVKTVLREVSVIDDELKSIMKNQATLDRSPAIRREEYDSLKLRYPDIVIPPTATTRQMYRALYAYRMKRAATVRPTVERQIAQSKTAACASLTEVRKIYADLLSSDEYKRANLQERLDLRSTLDQNIKDLIDSEIGDPCL